MSKSIKRLFIAISIILGLGIIGLIISWYSPYAALRAKLLIMGYPKSAFTAEIVEINNDSNDENIKFYYFDKRPIDSFGAQLGNFKVTKKGSIYLVDYIGRG